MQITEIIRRPLVTEKFMHLTEKRRQYAFEVAPEANKSQIKEAVERLFKVEVTSVNTLTTLGKVKRSRQGMYRKPAHKKAIVTLAEGFSIDQA